MIRNVNLMGLVNCNILFSLTDAICVLTSFHFPDVGAGVIDGD